ncbi:QueT transporter family protein [Virgibacillus sp. MSJ-26]|uniref:QueT transporter family protein n=1 Tax=Virgibacillus sp. MSJ-26 TaxID=2841522 RepID=UPI001C105718|nr:QueT transporter family protein [Virgibacillus sp. MSJ-26]MBU5466850.1 QueT transporter family protein [Virgibacillus sp. MSJ-26]
MKIRTLVTNGLIAALYIAVTALIQPFGFTNIQFRLSELFNHLIVFNKKYFTGIALGVLLANLLMSEFGIYEIPFGLGMTVISLLISMAVGKVVKNIWVHMTLNTVIFSFNTVFLAWMFKLAAGWPFLFTWATSAISEFLVMTLGMPIIYILHKRLHFDKLI